MDGGDAGDPSSTEPRWPLCTDRAAHARARVQRAADAPDATHRPWCQVGPFTIRCDPDGGCITGVRWTPGRWDMEWQAAERRLVHTVAAASLPFLDACLRRTHALSLPIDAFLLLPNAHHRMGSFRVDGWQAPNLVLTLCPEAPVDDGASTTTVGTLLPSVPCTVLHLLATEWGVDVVATGIALPLPDATAQGTFRTGFWGGNTLHCYEIPSVFMVAVQPPPFQMFPATASPYIPDAILHNVLSDRLWHWCGGSRHRLGRS